jgi:uncharacterized protein (TIGR00369 family)
MEITKKFLDRLNDNTLYETVGITIEEAGEGTARSRLEPDACFCWPFPGQPHGGILFTLMDTTMAWAVFSQLKPGYSCATINLEIQYTRPAKGKLFTCSARTTHRTGHLSFVRGEVHDAEGQVLAMGQGTFRNIRFDIEQLGL